MCLLISYTQSFKTLQPKTLEYIPFFVHLADEDWWLCFVTRDETLSLPQSHQCLGGRIPLREIVLHSLPPLAAAGLPITTNHPVIPQDHSVLEIHLTSLEKKGNFSGHFACLANQNSDNNAVSPIKGKNY